MRSVVDTCGALVACALASSVRLDSPPIKDDAVARQLYLLRANYKTPRHTELAKLDRKQISMLADKIFEDAVNKMIAEIICGSKVPE